MADKPELTEEQVMAALEGHKLDPNVAFKLIKTLWAVNDTLDNMTTVMADLAYEIRQLKESLPKGPS